MPSYLLRIISPGQPVKNVSLNRLMAIRAEPGAKYMLLDRTGSQVVADLKLSQTGSTLVVEAEGQKMLYLNRFYNNGLNATFDTAGSGAPPVETPSYTAPPAEAATATAETPPTSSTPATNQPSWAGVDLGISKLGSNMGGMLLGGAALLGAAALAGGSKDDNNDNGAGAPPRTSTTITGTVVAGPLLPGHDLKIKLYKALNNNDPDISNPLVGETDVKTDGSFTFNTTYKGVVIAHVYSTNASNKDFKDETIGDKNLDTSLYATGIANGDNLTLNINPLTSIAYYQATLTEDSVNNHNAAIAKVFGLDNLNDTPTLVNVSGNGFDASNGLSAAEKYGVILAALSGLDNKNSSMLSTINTLKDHIIVSGNTATLDNTAQQALRDGIQNYLTNSTASKGFGLDVTSSGISVVQSQALTLNNISLSSDTSSDTLVAGNKLFIDLQMSTVAKFTQSSSSQWPQLQITIGDQTVKADFITSTNNTNTLRFSYTVPAGLTDTDGVSLAANSIVMNGATLADSYGNSVSSIDTPAKSANASLKVDSAAPTATLQTNMAVQLEATGNISGEDYSPQITKLGSNGQYVVVWRGSDNTGTSTNQDIYVQKFNADGSPAGSAKQIDAVKVTNTTDHYPVVTEIGQNGEFVVTWPHYQVASDSSISRKIGVQKFDSSGEKVGSPAAFIDSHYNELVFFSGPTIQEVGTAGEFLVAWDGPDRARQNQTEYVPSSVFIQKFNTNGTTTGNDLISIKGETVVNFAPQITSVGSSGNFVVTWYGGDTEGDASVYLQKFSANGTKQTDSPIKLEAPNVTDKNDTKPIIVPINNTEEFIVSWIGQDSTNDGTIFVQKFNAAGSAANTAVSLDATGVATGADNNPSISVLNSDGEFVVAWEGANDSNGSTYSIYVQRFNADGSKNGDALKLNGLNYAQSDNTKPQVATLNSDGDFVVVWQSSAFGKGIHLQRFNVDGEKVGNEEVLNANRNSTGEDSNPQITVMPNSSFVITWQGQDDRGDDSIFVQKFLANGLRSSELVNTAVIASGEKPIALSDQAGKLYLVHESITASSVSAIENAATDLWTSTSNVSANTPTSLPSGGLIGGNYRIFSTDMNGNLSPASSSTVIIKSIQTVKLADRSETAALAVGDTIQVKVPFDQAITVDISAGTPTVTLNIGDTMREARYDSGSGTTELTFKYTITSQDNDSNGVEIQRDSLTLNGGSIKYSSGFNAGLAFDQVAAHANYTVDNTPITASFEHSGVSKTEAPVLVNASKIGTTVYMVNSTVTVNSLADITGAADKLWNKTPTTISDNSKPSTFDTTGLIAGDYKLYTVDSKGVFNKTPSETTTVLSSDVSTSVVVFDLVQGVSSAHSNRTFDSNTSYTIYIKTNNDTANLSTDGTGSGKADSWWSWIGGGFLGADDKVVMVGNNGSILGNKNKAANALAHNAQTARWNSDSGFAGRLFGSGQLVRAANSANDVTRLWLGTWQNPNQNATAGNFANYYLTAMPTNILATQGLA